MRETFTVGSAVYLALPVGALEEAATVPGVVHIEQAFTQLPPPDTNPDNDVDDGREIINSDTYFDHGFDGSSWYYIGLLDSGVRDTHDLFDAPDDFIALERDCVNGGADCDDTSATGYDPDDDWWNHGTSTAAIMAGNDSMGDAYRGVGEARVDSFKIYSSSGLDVTAALRGFDKAVDWADTVIVAEIQSSQSETGSLATAADDAYDSGVIVIATNGNFGSASGTVNAPANAHKALGIGARHVETLAQYSSQSRGPTGDSRIKPDLQAPNESETASTSCTNCLQTFGGTSGAAPYAGAGAALMADWFSSSGFGSDPGQIYAALLAMGENAYPMDNTEGAGMLEMGNLYCRRWLQGKRTLTHGSTATISFATVASQRNLKVAIWWPEATSTHNDIDLRIYDATGTLRDYSVSSGSVFEIGEVAGGLSPAGTWDVQLSGYSVTGSQEVYYQIYHEVSPYDCD